jgi:DNA-repair protein complementing XP-A cells
MAKKHDAEQKKKNDGAGVEVARKFMNYIEYDFSKMKDSKGGFMVDEDEGRREETKTILERRELLQQLKKPFFDPAPSLNPEENPKCCECGSMELDFLYHKTFGTRVCYKCKEKFPEKYSLLTKTECKEDYLLTDPELRDEEILPHLLKPNPHKSTFANMMLYVRYQVEEFAWKKWGGPEGLDEEWERREKIKKEKKDKKFEQQLRGLLLK